MEKFTVTIARGFGSGGRTIGKMLADKLGVKFYDKELIRMASDASGINEALFGQSDEKTKNSVFGKPGVYKGEVIAPEKSGFISEENLFNYQAMVIKQIASEGSCIIVGRCADYVLREQENVFSVFITAPMEQRAQRVSQREGISLSEAQEKAKKMDKVRKEYYNYFTNKRWGHTDSYQLCIDSSLLGEEGTAAFIRDFVRKALEKKSGK